NSGFIFGGREAFDTTVQPKSVMFPTDAKLINRAREKLVKLARKYGLDLRQSYASGGQVRLDQASALCPRQAVQAGQQGVAHAQNISRAHYPRHHPQDRWRRRAV